ncbi:DNA polymerase-3 subunit gamma/tau [Roseibium hamelinense]|uniref:DNA polymerase III subunit gamma/tau n=1 Tax=Roseibium hamelinense TaxID=150831 RepID=A0A562T178_9HYPH|nr:DNA polymerase III subunit gamma/tau [Roseibium hamelinense]MTI44635.1 DNA polymerase III subunit gamma/tau [Roseibium hamelinense]TWI87262.1 DNA polymerase-3 subunit gamma/tau [Roseibium hamelinense]
MDDIAFPQDGTSETPQDGGAYRVLARKYRPKTFEDLVGQEPMVQTLENAFETGRIAQAWMLTGVRGVGKTTTARILARGLNYEVPGQTDKPTVKLEHEGVHCRAIMEGRHVDVIEMDAASHTGIGDIREIIDASRYRPASARYKVYIIDEVHMLSNAAFNGLLKTLEEPPEHVKFIFATTEIRKVPITVLSRCQRFDLRRIDQAKLTGLLRRISDAESIQISDEALLMIARAGEGSARDSLSLLDQAMAHGAGAIEADDLRQMLGLADRARVIDLFEHIMHGRVAEALDELSGQYEVGADPAVVLTDLADFTHLVTRMKIAPRAADEGSVTEVERVRGQAFAETLSIRLLSRAWQILLKGLQEVQAAPKPLSAADMVLVRLAYAADLPDPGEALLKLQQGGPVQGAGAQSAPPGGPPPQGGPSAQTDAGPKLKAIAGGASRVQPAAQGVPEHEPLRAVAQAEPEPPALILRSLQDCAALASEKRDIPMKVAIERQMRLVKIEQGRIEIQPTPDAPADIAGEFGRKLTDWTGTRWMVSISQTPGRPTIHEEREANQAQLLSDAKSHPTVAALLAHFPGAKVIDVQVKTSEDEDPALADPLLSEALGEDDSDDV